MGLPSLAHVSDRPENVSEGVSIAVVSFVETVSGPPGPLEPRGDAMPATTAILSETSARTATAHPLRRATVAAGLVGAAVTTVVAAAVHAVGVSFEDRRRDDPAGGASPR